MGANNELLVLAKPCWCLSDNAPERRTGVNPTYFPDVHGLSAASHPSDSHFFVAPFNGTPGQPLSLGTGWDQMAMGQSHWYHFGVGAPPILEPILVVGLNRMFTGGTVWILTHGQILMSCDLGFSVLGS